MSNETQTPPAFPHERAKNHITKRSMWLVILLCVVIYGVGNGFVSDIIANLDGQNGTKAIDGLKPAFILASLAFGLVGTLILSIKFWRSIDEAARRAHLDAFYWGGPISWMVMAPFVVLPHKVMGFELPYLDSLNMTTSQIFGLGIITTIGVTLVGYVVAWSVWWVAKR